MGDGGKRAKTDRRKARPGPGPGEVIATRLEAVLRAAVSEDAARLAKAALGLREKAGEDRRIDRHELSRAAGFGDDPMAAMERLFAAERATIALLGHGTLDWQGKSPPSRARSGGRDRLWFNAPDDDDDKEDATVAVSEEMVRLAEPQPWASAGFERRAAPTVDAVTGDWVAAIADASKAGSALHLALRCRNPGTRETEDFCNLLADAGLPVLRIEATADEKLASALVTAELHAPRGTVVVVGGGVLVADAVDDDAFEAPVDDDRRERLEPTAFACTATSWLSRLRAVHVWRMPHRGDPGTAFDGFLGGCVGPIGYDRTWVRGVVHDALEGVGEAGVAALTARVGDPRDAEAMARAAGHLAAAKARGGGDPDLDAACAAVAGSFSERSAPAAPMIEPPGFDPRLLACDPDALALLDRAGAAAANGARVLAWGPPGGGKSTFAQALAVRMANASSPKREVILVTPAGILAKALGATERIMESMWARAANAAGGAVLLVDELDAMCGVRNPGGGSSGNAYLVRVLTDQWLRCLDLHPDVPIVATVNDLAAVDAAIRRRFFDLGFGGELSPEAERLAWEVILLKKPPPGWAPCGAAIADIAMSARKCRVLAIEEASGFAKAIEQAREARTGLAYRHVNPKAKTPLH